MRKSFFLKNKAFYILNEIIHHIGHKIKQINLNVNNMSTQTVYAMLAIAAVVGGVGAVSGTMSDAYASHEFFGNQGKCIQFANAHKQNPFVTKEDIKEFIDIFCKHD